MIIVIYDGLVTESSLQKESLPVLFAIESSALGRLSWVNENHYDVI